MGNETAIVRQALKELPEVSRTWFEWSFENGHHVKTLVVEVDFDTDPNCSGFNIGALERVEKIAVDVLHNKTTMMVSHLKVVPADKFR